MPSVIVYSVYIARGHSAYYDLGQFQKICEYTFQHIDNIVQVDVAQFQKFLHIKRWYWQQLENQLWSEHFFPLRSSSKLCCIHGTTVLGARNGSSLVVGAGIIVTWTIYWKWLDVTIVSLHMHDSEFQRSGFARVYLFYFMLYKHEKTTFLSKYIIYNLINISFERFCISRVTSAVNKTCYPTTFLRTRILEIPIHYWVQLGDCYFENTSPKKWRDATRRSKSPAVPLQTSW